jgi:hypothetical protein
MRHQTKYCLDREISLPKTNNDNNTNIANDRTLYLDRRETSGLPPTAIIHHIGQLVI